jgi:hypothetical protein
LEPIGDRRLYMQVNGPVNDIIINPVVLKNGPRAGQTSKSYTAVIQGMKVDFGFKAPKFAVGDLVNLTISDTPNKWGKHELMSASVSSTGIISPPNSISTTNNLSNKTGQSNGTRNSIFPVPKTHGDTAIMRQNALTNAVNMLNHCELGPYPVDTVLEVAALFAKWTSGQLEQEEAEKLLSASVHESNI